ncbi:MAG: hypothetical protein SGCHY_002362 [Lobulomycetales sp.]
MSREFKDNVFPITSTWLNMIKPQSYHNVIQTDAEKGQGAGNWYERSLLFEHLPQEALELIWEESTKYPGKDGALIVVPLGGAVGEIPSDGTAFAFRKAKYWIAILAKWYSPIYIIAFRRTGNNVERDGAVEWVRNLHRNLFKYTMGEYQALGQSLSQSYAPDKQEVDVWRKQGDGNLVYGKNKERLKKLKKKYDPTGLFKYNRNI